MSDLFSAVPATGQSDAGTGTTPTTHDESRQPSVAESHSTTTADIAIDDEFRGLIPPLAHDEYAQLVANLRAEGCREPLVLWREPPDGQRLLLLDGHNRYAICQEYGIPYQVMVLNDTVPLLTRQAAMVWILRNQLGRRNLSDIDRVGVALKLKPLLVEQGKERQGARTDLFQNFGKSDEPPSHTHIAIAELSGVSHETARKAETVLEKGAPSLVQAVRDSKASISAAADVATLPAPEQEEIVARGEKEILDAAKRIRAEKAHRNKFTGENEWYTPPEYIAMARTVLGGIDVDPASSEIAQETIQAGQYYSLENDAFQHEWYGRVWLNPPYSQPLIGQFIDKLLGELAAGHTTSAILLTHNYTDTAWFHAAAQQAAAVCFPQGRIRFVSALGDIAAPMQGQAFFYFGTEADRFVATFHAIGLVLTVCHV